MSTKATIKIEGVDYCKIYKHRDGYGLRKKLEEFNKEFFEKRGVDSQYKIAQLLRHSVFLFNDGNIEQEKFTGWGIVGYNTDCGEEYEYELLYNGEVIVKHIQLLELIE